MCKKGGLSNSDAWDRVEVFAQEFFMDVHSFRIVSSKRNAADMCWGAMKATDRVEQYRREKFIEFSKVTSILALTSMEHEGKGLTEALGAVISDRDKVKAMDVVVKRLEKELKTLKDKVHGN